MDKTFIISLEQLKRIKYQRDPKYKVIKDDILQGFIDIYTELELIFEDRQTHVLYGVSYLYNERDGIVDYVPEQLDCEHYEGFLVYRVRCVEINTTMYVEQE